ncbi:MAG: hypothetical protein DMG82_02025 [Acidobacteria bacterium]|nr:MAG: hypothetical protein DMG82_02025 [Acidobacteriota bacterium]PYX42750.1 MAG: hypothetical protein DMG83_19750 [Acidobacteriota bacterium]
MWQTDKNTAEKPVVTREAKTWKSHVNATIWHVPSRFGSSREEMPPTWPADVNGKDLSEFADGVLSKEN